MKKVFFILFAHFWAVLSADAQNTIGLPSIHNFSKLDYAGGTQNWGIAQDANGVMYFANNEGVLCYDGTKWRLYPLPNKTIVRSIAIDQNGRIFAGGQGEMGYFLPNKTGELVFHSLLSSIPEQYRSLSDVWDIVCHENNVFFRTSNAIYRLIGDNINIYSNEYWLFIGHSPHGVIAQSFSKGLTLFYNGEWVSIAQKNHLPEDATITAALSLSKDSLLLATFKHGIYLLHKNKIERYPFPLLNQNRNYHISHAAIIDTNRIAFATPVYGSIITDFKGNTIQFFSKSDGLQKNNIHKIYSDANKNIWLGLDNGIDFIAYDSPIKHIYTDQESKGSGYSAVIHEEKLYIATSGGVYYAPIYELSDMSFVKSNFTLLRETLGQSWNLSVVNNKLLIGHHEGAFLVDNNRLVPLDQSIGYWTFQPLSSVQPSEKIITGTYLGLKVFNFSNNRFTTSEADNIDFESSRFVVVDNNEVWVSHPYKGVFRVTINENGKGSVQSYSGNSSQPFSINGNYIFKIKNKIVVATEKGVYEYQSGTNQFILSSLLNDLLGTKIIRYLKEDKDGNVWFVFEKNLGLIDFSRSTPHIIYFPELNKKMVSGFEQVYFYNSKNVLVGSENGYFHINLEKYKLNSAPMNLLIREARIKGKTDSLVFGGYTTANNDNKNITLPDISYKWNSIHFEYSAPVFAQQSNLEYSYYLKGYDKRWGDWSSKTEKEYNYLPAGTYVFEVKARNHIGNESEIYSCTFTILPPWYETRWAYIAYIFLLIFLIYYLYKWQRKKFIEQGKSYEEEQKRLQYLHQLEIDKNEKEIITLKNEKLEAELMHQNKEMASTTMHLVKKGELISKLKTELQQLSKNTNDEHSIESFKKIIKTLNEEEKVDDDWEHFTIHFDKAHNDFFIALKQKHANLTPNELKLCAYLRMNLSTKEMAQLMNISVRGVEISRYRLRKKLGIDSGTNLFSYLLAFHSSSGNPEKE